jgi:hypothetical protein
MSDEHKTLLTHLAPFIRGINKRMEAGVLSGSTFLHLVYGRPLCFDIDL